MKFAVGFILVIVMAFVAPFFLPWWGISVLAGVVGLLVGANWGQSFLYGFTGAGLAWTFQVFQINVANENILAAQMAELFKMQGPMMLVYITGLLGSILGGLGTLSGSLIRSGFTPKKRKRRSPNISTQKRRKNRRF